MRLVLLFRLPGLSADNEIFDFLRVCCREFNVPEPSGEHIPLIQEETASLPLLIETIIGLRRFSSNYPQALQTFREKGGDEARRYLYQREYDNLSQAGKSRYILATLLLLEDPVTSVNLCSFTQFSSELVAEALTETSSVFLSAFEGSSGETLFQLSPPAVRFVEHVSERLAFFPALKRKVEHLKKEGGRDNPRDAAVIFTMKSMLRQGAFEKVTLLANTFSKDDSVMANPKVNALIGQARSELGPSFREDARLAFRLAESMAYRDVFMLRSWFNLEFSSGYGYPEAKRICQLALDDSRFGPRHKTEFYSKLGSCLFQEALGVVSASREKALSLFRSSVKAYFDGVWVGKNVTTLDLGQTLAWSEKPLQRLTMLVGTDISEYLQLIDELADAGHDLERGCAHLVVRYMSNLPSSSQTNYKNMLKGFCARSIQKIQRGVRPVGPGFQIIIQALNDLRDWADTKPRSQQLR